MKIIDQAIHSFQETPTDFEGCLKLIECAGRTCYGSTDKITETSARPFVEGLIKRGHLSVLRHSNLGIICRKKPMSSPYMIYEKDTLAGNFQAIMEMFGFIDLGAINMFTRGQIAKDVLPPECRRYTAHITTSLRNSHQLVRHTTLAVSQKSTRYIDHSNLEVIRPWWKAGNTMEDEGLFVSAMQKAEAFYNELLCEGVSKEDAADVLPKATATEMWITGDRAAWLNLKAQRLDGTTGKPSKQMSALMSQMPWEVIE